MDMLIIKKSYWLWIH